jgi:hypothetical protein
MVIIPHVKISDSATEKDAMERAVIGLGRTVTGDMEIGGEEAASTFMGQSCFPLKYASYSVWGAPNGTVPQQIHEVHGVDQCIGPKSGWEIQGVHVEQERDRARRVPATVTSSASVPGTRRAIYQSTLARVNRGSRASDGELRLWQRLGVLDDGVL